MGASNSSIKIGFEDMQQCCSNPGQYKLINTMPPDMQGCLIPSTSPADQEEDVLNDLMKNNRGAHIVVYGTNCNDESIYTKYNQLTKCGFTNVSLYPGGMFEWLLLRDTYGEEEFPVTQCELDLLRYKPPRSFNGSLIA
jgi:hypothetical protein